MAQRIDQDQVRHIATLSRLKLTNAEVARLSEQLSGILDYVDKLNELDTSGVEPTAHVAGVQTVMRGDEPEAPLAVEDALANAPAREQSFYQVPKVLDTESA